MIWTPKGKRIVKPSMAECRIFGHGLALGMGARLGGFSPAALAAIRAWFRADLGVTNVSGKASVWANQIAGDTNTNLLQGTAGNRPPINATDAAYNNQASLSGGATVTMASLAWAVPIAQPFTWWVVGNDDGLNVNEYYIEGNIDGLNRSIIGGSVVSNVYSTFSGTELGTGARTSSPIFIMGVGDAASSKIHLNSMTPATTGNSGSNGITALTVFSAFSGGAPLIGKIVEIGIQAAIITTTEKASLRGYLNSRYAMAIAA